MNNNSNIDYIKPIDGYVNIFSSIILVLFMTIIILPTQSLGEFWTPVIVISTICLSVFNIAVGIRDIKTLKISIINGQISNNKISIDLHRLTGYRLTISGVWLQRSGDLEFFYTGSLTKKSRKKLSHMLNKLTSENNLNNN